MSLRLKMPPRSRQRGVVVDCFAKDRKFVGNHEKLKWMPCTVCHVEMVSRPGILDNPNLKVIGKGRISVPCKKCKDRADWWNRAKKKELDLCHKIEQEAIVEQAMGCLS